MVKLDLPDVPDESIVNKYHAAPATVLVTAALTLYSFGERNASNSVGGLFHVHIVLSSDVTARFPEVFSPVIFLIDFS